MEEYTPANQSTHVPECPFCSVDPCPRCFATFTHVEALTCSGLMRRIFFWCWTRKFHEHRFCNQCQFHWRSFISL